MPTKQPEKPEGHPKLDPRLAMLMALDGKNLEDLIAIERRDLREIGAQIQALTEQYSAESPEAEAVFLKEIRRLYGRLFAPMSAGVVIPDDPKSGPEKSNELELSVFIKAFGSAEQLARHGARIRSRAGNIFTAFVPLSSLAALEQAPEVEYVELARAVFPSGPPVLAPAPAQTQVQPKPVLVGRRGPAAFDGSGTIVGIIDSTLDLYHTDFRRVQGGKTRVLYLWDQTLQPTGAEQGPSIAATPESPNGFHYGVEYDSTAIDTQLGNFPFLTGPYQLVRHNQAGEKGSHGTAVTGLAAGNGRGNRAYPGSAPGSDIIFVAQTDPHSVDLLADNVQVMDAFSYIFEQARLLGRPCVANLSNGDNLGPHDGSSLGELFLDALLETPGRAVTLSAGNSTGTSSHATGALAQGASTVLEVQCDPSATRSDTVEVWYDGKHAFDATITVPGLAPVKLSPGDLFLKHVTPGGVEVTLSSIVGPAGSNYISVIFLVPSGKTMPLGKTLIKLTATKVTGSAATFHAWIDRNNRDHTGIASVRFLTHVDETSLTLGTPGTARHPITVGNHDSNRKIAGTSGLGPTRDGRMKPELAAGGVDVMAPFSWPRAPGQPTGQYGPMSGTSASAPWVAGVCACLFQRYGAGLNWAQMKQLLIDPCSPLLPQNGFGHGCLETGPLLGNAKPPVDVWIMDDPADTGAGPNAAPVIWASPDIQMLDMNRLGKANLTRSAAAGAAANNIVRVRVRNRGTMLAMNTQVVLAWTEGTTLARSGTWQSAGVFVDAATNFTTPGNLFTIAALAPGAFTDVEFGFAPPPGLADQPITLIVRLDNAQDPWLATSQSGTALGMRNNLAMRTVLVATPAAGAAATLQFNVVGNAAGESDGLVVTSDPGVGQVKLQLPLAALPANRHGAITGQAGLAVAAATVEITMSNSPLLVPFLALGPGQSVLAKLTVSGVAAGAGTKRVHVAQRSGGPVVGGASLEVRA